MSSELETGSYIISHPASGNRLHNSAIDGDGQTAIVGAEPREDSFQTWNVSHGIGDVYFIECNLTFGFLFSGEDLWDGATLAAHADSTPWHIKQEPGTLLYRICLFSTDYYLDLPDDEPDTKCELKEGGKQAWAFTRAGW